MFWGPGMILHAHCKITISKKQFGFLLPLETPPDLVKTRLFTDFFPDTFPYAIMSANLGGFYIGIGYILPTIWARGWGMCIF